MKKIKIIYSIIWAALFLIIFFWVGNEPNNNMLKIIFTVIIIIGAIIGFFIDTRKSD
ncbi:MAG: hypothetical protein LKI80_06895 [Sporolactobacillus sp.]|jgi:heme/copper-type cytochrome/quinol oxidase subunit 4|nr:hypothetical protein [Sporolactobacillus sp.]